MIIGILGRKGHGKDTIANYLINTHNFTGLSFAEPLKQILEILFGFDHEQLYGDKKESVDELWKISPRQAMQYIGTELFRKNIGNLLPDVGEDFWLKCMENKIKKIKGNIVISDVRFQNEVDFIKSLGGKIIKVHRDLNSKFDIHESENNIDLIKNYDAHINNNYSFEALHKKIELCLNLF